MKQTILHMMEYDCNKRIPIFSLHNNLQEITHIYQREQEFSVGWTTTMRFFRSIQDTDGLQRMCRKGILSTLKSSNNPKQIKVFMQVTWSLTTEEEIIPKRFPIFQKEH